ncbi:hypothetical protein SB00610_05386 [Klebsiella quasipneumoniae subsp. similipneumoniae]|nr:hypothetical protein SB00610_05386 [Klebsiella quasipneumoniae subsp. similipneumoniae]
MSELQGITQQVGQDLPQPGAIDDQHLRHRRGDIHQQLNALFAGGRHMRADQRLNKRADLQRLYVHLHLARLNA